MKIKIYFFMVFIISLFFLSMPKSVFAACCEFYNGKDSQCINVAEGKAVEDICNEQAKQAGMRVRYSPKQVCDKSGKECICPKGKTCLELQVPFPGSQAIEDAAQNLSGQQGLLAKYIVAIFQFGIWAAISLAIFMIMVAGFMWLISAGNQGMISKAKGYITNALYGLIIALTSYIILQTINPQLVALRMPAINAVNAVAKVGNQCCYETTTFDVKNDIELVGGQTCQDAFGRVLGGTWKNCKDSGVKELGPCCGCWTGTGFKLRRVCYKGLNSSSCADKASWLAQNVVADFGGDYSCKLYLYSCETLPTEGRDRELWCGTIDGVTVKK